MKIKEMTSDEKLALGTLVRIMIRLDGDFSREEFTELGAVALDLGEDDFWEVVEHAGHHDLSDDSAMARARAVERTEARETIFATLLGIAESGGIVSAEPSLLEWLAQTWDLDLEVESAGDAT